MNHQGHVWTCLAWDATNASCTSEGWAAAPSAMPTLSVADAQVIGWSIALLWSTAWIFRQCKKMLDL